MAKFDHGINLPFIFADNLEYFLKRMRTDQSNRSWEFEETRTLCLDAINKLAHFLKCNEFQIRQLLAQMEAEDDEEEKEKK